MDLKHIAAEAREAFDMHKGRAKYSTIRDRILGSARLDGIHMFQLIAAMLIASIGLNTNSTEAVIGAMLICPLMGSVLAMAYAVASIDMHVLRHAVGGILLQCGICLVTSTLYFLISPLSNETSELLTNSTATIWDVLIALVGGFAGALGLSRRQEPQTLLAGVAVATALMPPLCSVGYGLSLGDFVHAGTSLYEFLINVLFISKTRTAMLYLGLTFFWMAMTEKRVHPLLKILSFFLIYLLLVAAVALSDRLIPAVRAYMEQDPGIMVRFRAIDHYLAQFRAYPLTGIGLISNSKSIPGWELLYGPRGQYYRSDVGAVGLINEFGLLGLFWVIWFLLSSFRRAGRSSAVLPRVIRSLVVFLTVSMVNLSMMDPGRCMYIFLVCTFLETLPADKAGRR